MNWEYLAAVSIFSLMVGCLSVGVAFAFCDVEKSKSLIKAFVGGFVGSFIFCILFVHPA